MYALCLQNIQLFVLKTYNNYVSLWILLKWKTTFNCMESFSNGIIIFSDGGNWGDMAYPEDTLKDVY